LRLRRCPDPSGGGSFVPERGFDDGDFAGLETGVKPIRPVVPSKFTKVGEESERDAFLELQDAVGCPFRIDRGWKRPHFGLDEGSYCTCSGG